MRGNHGDNGVWIITAGKTCSGMRYGTMSTCSIPRILLSSTNSFQINPNLPPAERRHCTPQMLPQLPSSPSRPEIRESSEWRRAMLSYTTCHTNWLSISQGYVVLSQWKSCCPWFPLNARTYLRAWESTDERDGTSVWVTARGRQMVR